MPCDFVLSLVREVSLTHGHTRERLGLGSVVVSFFPGTHFSLCFSITGNVYFIKFTTLSLFQLYVCLYVCVSACAHVCVVEGVCEHVQSQRKC